MDCGVQDWAFPRLEGWCGYQDAGAELIRLYKFGGLVGLLDVWVSDLASRLVPRAPLVPIPPHRRHLWQRGWDPVQFLITRLSRASGLPTWSVLRRRPSVSQKSLDRSARVENAQNSYCLSWGVATRLRGTPLVWLVDDVVTTGATVEACSRILVKAGVQEVRVFCLGLH